MQEGITHFGLRNFKAFHFLEDLELRPLTVLVGANSSGKSSILQSLLLLKQTLLSSSTENLLSFDGDLVRLGGFQATVSTLDASRPLEFRFQIARSSRVEEMRGLFPEMKPSPPGLKACCRLIVRFTAASNGGLTVAHEMSISPGAQYSEENAVAIEMARMPEGDEMQAVGGRMFALRKFLPEFLLNVGQSTGGLSIDKSHDPPAAHGQNSPELILNSFLRRLESQLIRIQYMGPVRADPQPFYPVGQDPDIGPRGSGAIPYLLRHRGDNISYFTDLGGAPKQGTLLKALNTWLQRMGVIQETQELSLDLVQDLVFSAKLPAVSSPGKTISLAQVGFGVSQLLPVLLMGLKPPPGLLLYEQPEIHLHPRLQGELADFFLCAAQGPGRFLLVETHSDYLINRLRRRIAEDASGRLARLVSILFVHPGTQDNPSSYVEPLEVGPDGTIQNCPADFFSETADEAFALLRARAQRVSRPGS